MNPVVIGLLVLLSLLGIYIITAYNGLIRLKNQIEEALSTIDVQSKKRYDLIPNLVNIVKAYANHEQQTFKDLIQARSMGMGVSNGDINGRIQSDSMVSGALGHLFAVAEAYPVLQSNTNFLDLQQQLRSIEEDLSNARSYYNGCVLLMNNKVESFPSSIIASSFGFKPQPFYEVTNPAEKQSVQVQF